MKMIRPELKTLHNVIMNTACSEPVMEERQKKSNEIKEREKNGK